ncbi:MAG: adenylate kinase [Candidatus Bathyarchaeota archaeon]|nr:adenylate kinase [Candidatus Bathyarchaeota archaeon]
MRLIILGPPGAGKGTQAKIISEIYGIPLITAGDLLRDAVAKGTEKGMTAGEYIKKGDLVPDEIVNGLMEERLDEPDVEEGFILDGFPRNLEQARALDRILEKKETTIDAILKVDAKTETIVNRLSLRRTCPRCGAVYHLLHKPPKRRVCDECGGELVQRDDDKEDVIRHRFQVYEEQTRPILDRYEKTGRVREVSGEIGIEMIPDEVRRVLGDLA